MKLRPNSPLRSTVLAIAVGINLFVGLLTTLAAYGGLFDPEERVIMAMIAMTLPAVLIAGILLMIADLFIDRRLALIILVSWLVSAPPILDFSPLNLFGRRLGKAERERSFTLLTYNVLHFFDFRGENPDLDANATLSYILSTDADIVNLQEFDMAAYTTGSLEWSDEKGTVNGEYWHLRQSQIDSLYARYPYRAVNRGKELSVFSKYPMTTVDLGYLPSKIAQAMACYRLDIKGREIHLINVHLRSIGLTDADKTLYKDALREVPESKRELKREISDVKSQLLGKLAVAFRGRVQEAKAVRNIIDSIGGPFIVAGDFNDIPDCYAVRTILGDDMSDAYSDAAFGPTITYHGDRFYFRIDQVLYRGPFDAVDIRRGAISSSDHNPLLTTFVLDGDSGTTQ